MLFYGDHISCESATECLCQRYVHIKVAESKSICIHLDIVCKVLLQERHIRTCVYLYLNLLMYVCVHASVCISGLLVLLLPVQAWMWSKNIYTKAFLLRESI